MGTLVISFLQTLWPFSRKLDDIKLSDRLVSKLSIPDQTKRFVFVVQDPQSESTIYILATQNLSLQSAIDAELLIKEVRPDAVIAQIGSSVLDDIQEEERSSSRGNAEDQVNILPISSFGVIKDSFINKFGKDKYEYLAGNEVLKGIFGIGFQGHFLAARNAAREVGSSILLLSDNEQFDRNPSLFFKLITGFMNKEKNESLGLGSSSLVPARMSSLPMPSLKRLCLTNDHHLHMVKSIVSQSVLKLNSGSVASDSEAGVAVLKPDCDYHAPSYAHVVYPLLSDLHDIFSSIPSIGKAMAHAQNMLYKVDKGETVETQLLSEVRAFRVALEGMRVGLNNAGRCTSNNRDHISSKSEFSELSTDEKSHALFAKALRNQTNKFKSIVAIVDASSLAGLRKHWDTPVPEEIEDLTEKFFIANEDNLAAENGDKQGMLSANKQVVAVGAGATAVLGVSSLSKLGPASTFMKLAAYKVPASLKLTLIQSQKAVGMVLGKTLGPAKLFVPGLGSSGAKSTSIMKAAASAEKIRAVAHSVIASAERTSFSTMRTAFYEIMRNRRVRPVGFMPWATFGCSVATCATLVAYGDGIEYAVESAPFATRIASLGRGIQSLRQASQVAADKPNMKEAMESLMYSSKK